MTATILCAHCGAKTPADLAVCHACGGDPRLDGRYRLLAELGRGAFGTTFRAERIEDGATFAIKELLIRRLDDFKTLDLFRREAALLRSLSHPGIPHYVDDFTSGSGRQTGLYLVVELIDGETLQAELAHRRLTVPDALGIARDVCDILVYLHALAPPLVHRDLKPANVMRRAADGRLVLIDFGAVKEVLRDLDPGSTVAGTFGYMPPEQLAGRAGPASDLYALGVLLVELLTRQPPQDLLDEQNRLRWEPFFESGPLRDLLADLLVPEPAGRLADAREARRRIDAILEGRAAARPAPRPAAAPASPRKSAQANAFHLATTPPPDPPRAIPAGFVRRADPFANFFRFFGLFFGLGPSVILVSVFSNLGSLVPLGMVLPFLVFPVTGLTFFTIGMRRAAAKKRLYRNGQTTLAEIVELSLDTRLRVNGRSPVRVVFRYQPTPDGEVLTGRVARFEIPLEWRTEGARAHAIFDPAHPQRAMLWPLS